MCDASIWASGSASDREMTDVPAQRHPRTRHADQSRRRPGGNPRDQRGFDAERTSENQTFRGLVFYQSAKSLTFRQTFPVIPALVAGINSSTVPRLIPVTSTGMTLRRYVNHSAAWYER